MQNIGEKLEEARKRQGISIREASDVTKIRSDYLLAFENNSLDLSLPDVYIRGFLRNYSTFLKLDAGQIITDFDALGLSQGKESQKNLHDLLGRMDLPEASAGSGSSDNNDAESAPKTQSPTNRTLYYKVALISGCVLIVILLITLLVNLVLSQKGPEINPELQHSAILNGNDPTNPPEADAQGVDQEEITLIALDDVNVVVRQKLDNKELFSGSIQKGEPITVIKYGPVRISFLEGDNLIVEKGGQKFSMGKSGPGTRSLD
ncbi:MAG: hypothetical protein DF168_01950 [Candidatus Moanabacter tarae]|uniref:Cytoskeleton protein RodZ n=1 Tax=Candidatus Moanibacter tarae TaxID=2200854 RepID=A0A2Z4AEX9_9BACT|nr:MAG: hypothetical protein DF168_01950 [Candidatus Moanabacter tarae]|tara:strand:+ start:15641 stop:16426 length:786 start_codon:yes stop_codon:yes gene_type:complete